jgi:hypothetical protein
MDAVTHLAPKDHEPGEDKSDASLPSATESDDTGAPEGLAHPAGLPANEEGKTQNDATPQSGRGPTVAEEPAESGGGVPGVTKAESVGDLRVKTR